MFPSQWGLRLLSAVSFATGIGLLWTAVSWYQQSEQPPQQPQLDVTTWVSAYVRVVVVGALGVACCSTGVKLAFYSF
jgi:hypothetical protein